MAPFFKILNFKTILVLSLLVSALGNAQIMQVNVLGGAEVYNGGALSVNAGNSVTFQITNTAIGNCSSVHVNVIYISDPANFSITPSNPSENIKSATCNNGAKFLNFTVTATGSACGTTTTQVTIEGNNFANFSFGLTVIKSPIISVFGSNADIIDGTTTTTATNGTYFGVVETGASATRRFYIMNTGSCPLELSSISSSIASPVLINNFTIATQGALKQYVDPGARFWIDVTFTAGDPANNEATISITNNTAADTDLFTFKVRAEVLAIDIPGPGGVTADFRLWLKATRGVTKGVSPTFTTASNTEKVSLWKDLGSNGKSATQTDTNLQPTFLDNPTSNINFNPVIEFENNGATDGTKIEQYLYNEINGFYSQDIFIVMMPKTPPPSTPITPFSSASSRNTIFSGVSKKAIDDNTFDADDITGVGFGDYTTTSFTDELLT